MKIEIVEIEDGEALRIAMSDGHKFSEEFELERDDAEQLCQKLSEALGHEDPQGT